MVFNLLDMLLMTTGAIGYNQEAYIDRLLRKYGLDQCNATKLPMNPCTDSFILQLLRMLVFRRNQTSFAYWHILH